MAWFLHALRFGLYILKWPKVSIQTGSSLPLVVLLPGEARWERFTPTMRRTSPVVSESCVTLFQIRIMKKKMHSSLLQKHIKWSFSPPHGSHFGGIWERCIRTVRKILHASLREQIAEDERLVTFVWSREHHEQATHHTCVHWSKQYRTPHTEPPVVSQVRSHFAT